MSVTQEDVAARAGVARKTVSNVINGYVHVSPGVRARVAAAVAELGYRPNHVARSLRSGRSRVIGLVVPELDVGYFAELARLVVIEAETHGFAVMVKQTLGSRDHEIAELSGNGTPFVEGLLYSPVALSGRELAGFPEAPPLVLLGERSSDGLLDHVGIDNVAAAATATDHLIALGCTRIAFLGSSPRADNAIGRLRAEGYHRALARGGLPDGLVINTVGYHRSHGADATAEALRGGADFDAVFCATDLLAHGAIRAIVDAGRRVPEDVAVVGFDGLDEARYSTPSLTTVEPDKASIARAAVARVIARIEDPELAVVELPISITLVVRESTAGWVPSTHHRPARR